MTKTRIGLRRGVLMAACFASIALIAGCGNQEAHIARAVEGFLPLETRAIDLREARFAIADSIRFAQDRMLALPENTPERAAIEGHIGDLMARKEELLRESLAIADTVKQTVKTLFSEALRSDSERERFYQKLNDELKARGYQVDESAG